MSAAVCRQFLAMAADDRERRAQAIHRFHKRLLTRALQAWQEGAERWALNNLYAACALLRALP